MRWDQPFSSSFHLRISLLLFQRGRRRNEFTEEGEVKGRLGGGGGGRGGKCTEGGGGAISLKGKEGRKERGIFLVSHCGGRGGGDDNADARQREGEKVFLAPFPSSLWSLFFASAEREIAFFAPSDRGGGFCDCCVPKLGRAPFSSCPFWSRYRWKRGRAGEEECRQIRLFQPLKVYGHCSVLGIFFRAWKGKGGQWRKLVGRPRRKDICCHRGSGGRTGREAKGRGGREECVK